MNIWRLMGGEFDASNLALWVEYFRVEDVELLIDSIMHIRQREAQ